MKMGNDGLVWAWVDAGHGGSRKISQKKPQLCSQDMFSNVCKWQKKKQECKEGWQHTKRTKKKGNNRTNQVLLPKIISTPGPDRGKERITKSERNENRGSSTEKT